MTEVTGQESAEKRRIRTRHGMPPGWVPIPTAARGLRIPALRVLRWAKTGRLAVRRGLSGTLWVPEAAVRRLAGRAGRNG
jgi:hypothetical protein